MQFTSMLTITGAVVLSMVTAGSGQLTSPTGCVPSLLNPVQCTLSWIFHTCPDGSADDSINMWINSSPCTTLLEGGGATHDIGSDSIIQPSTPGLTLPLELFNPTIATAGPTFIFNGTTYDVAHCTCGPAAAADDYACSCPFACSKFNNRGG